jgi:YhcH/YjgK/YiaL family protein
MIFSELLHWRHIPGFKDHPIWTTAFDWLEQNSALAAEGVHTLGQDGFFARVMRYPLKERKAILYESHRQTIDIQYTLEGAEGIEFNFAHDLEPLHDYSHKDDVEHFTTPAQRAAWIENSKGRFVIFFPGEPHMPQLATATIHAVHKVVVKIPAGLIEVRLGRLIHSSSYA